MNPGAYIEVIFPLAIPGTYSYKVPLSLINTVKIGMRVEVELGNKIHAAIVYRISKESSYEKEPKYLLSVLDDEPVVSPSQLEFWEWISMYYCCTLGEVMDAALPAGLKMKSESTFVFIENHTIDFTTLHKDEFIIAESLENRKELNLQLIQDLLSKKSVMPSIKSLISKNMISIREDMESKFKPKTIKTVALHPQLLNEELLDEAFQKIQKYDKQVKALMAIIEFTKDGQSIPIDDIKQMTNLSTDVFKTLAKKEYVILEDKVISRLSAPLLHTTVLPDLTYDQKLAIENIRNFLNENKPVLLHGVTGSGKTRIYQELIKEELDKGNQVLYLLPEIALTNHIIHRLYDSFGEQVLVYHSRMNGAERVEVWNEILQSSKVIVAARSGVFLPFQKLTLVIVDEEHDSSFKQDAPNPHYHARDAAIFLANKLQAKIILGSATPSVESYFNVERNKYGLVTLNNRYGDAILPYIQIVDLGYERKTGRFKDILSVPLIKAMQQTLSENKQIILFQNRRGYVPTVQCKSCGWTAICRNCDVNLTLHKYLHELKCHYCNYRIIIPTKCPNCESVDLSEIGVGTEKVEQKVQETFQNSQSARFDFDTTRTKSSQEKILDAFEKGAIQILIGTQMVTKGFDFDHIQLVGIINADTLLSMPDFRANERAFQLLTQVSGRAGRRSEQGRVIIQTYQPKHPVLADVINHNFQSFYQREIAERHYCKFPPYVRLIFVEIKHREVNIAIKAAEEIFKQIQSKIGDRVSLPITPAISKINTYYLRHLLIKLERKAEIIENTKKLLMEIKTRFSKEDPFKTVKIKLDVDPY